MIGYPLFSGYHHHHHLPIIDSMKKMIPVFLILSLSVLLISGCRDKGEKVIPVTGTITQNGQPLADVRVVFSKTDTGAMSFAETDTEGHFTLTHTHGKSGAEPGKYHVSVFQKGKPIPLPAGKKPEDVPEERRNQTTPDVPIINSDQSPIEVEITDSGQNNIVIDIK
ncbi:MAG: carboxypeptidase-like regulatory domain-containing protein [Planctomycetaceae bacterium]|nr:carboxypeptidase-like regulatory domain-containing protein [Planctomycetaceae bacterium]